VPQQTLCDEVATSLIDSTVDTLVNAVNKERQIKPINESEFSLVLKQTVGKNWFGTPEEVVWETWQFPFIFTQQSLPYSSTFVFSWTIEYLAILGRYGR